MGYGIKKINWIIAVSTKTLRARNKSQFATNKRHRQSSFEKVCVHWVLTDADDEEAQGLQKNDPHRRSEEVNDAELLEVHGHHDQQKRELHYAYQDENDQFSVVALLLVFGVKLSFCWELLVLLFELIDVLERMSSFFAILIFFWHSKIIISNNSI